MIYINNIIIHNYKMPTLLLSLHNVITLMYVQGVSRLTKIYVTLTNIKFDL
jgi:hypothetical protein